MSATDNSGTQQSWVPVQPQFAESKATVPCGYDTVQRPQETFYALSCGPVEGSEREDVNACYLRLVQNVDQALVQRNCAQNSVEVLSQVDQSRDPQGNVTFQPYVDIFSQTVPQPIAEGSTMYQFNQLSRGGGGNKSVGSVGGASVGGYMPSRAVSCQFPTMMTHDKNNAYPCSKSAVGMHGRCAEHASFALHTGGGEIDSPSVSTSGGGVPLTYMYNEGVSPDYSTLPPQSNIPIFNAGGLHHMGGLTGIQLPPSGEGLANVPKLSESQLRQFLSGMSTNTDGFRMISKDALEGLKSSDPIESGVRVYTYNDTFGASTTQVQREDGYNFSSRNKTSDFLNSIEKQYLMKLASVLLALSNKFGRFTDAVFDIRNDTIATLEAKIMVAVSRIWDWVSAGANNINLKKDFFRMNVTNADGRITHEGFFEGFTPFADAKDNLGNSLIHPDIRKYAFEPPQLLFQPPDFLRYRPAVDPRRRAYVEALRTVFNNLNTLSIEQDGNIEQASQRQLTLGGPNFVSNNTISAVSRFLGDDGKMVPVLVTDQQSHALLEAAVLALICKLMTVYGNMFNTNYVFASGGLSTKALLTNPVYVENRYVSPELLAYVNQFAYTVGSSQAPNTSDVAVVATKYIINQEKNNGVVFPVASPLRLSNIRAPPTGTATGTNQGAPFTNSLSGNVIFGANPLGDPMDPMFTIEPPIATRTPYSLSDLGYTPLRNPFPADSSPPKTLREYGGAHGRGGFAYGHGQGTATGMKTTTSAGVQYRNPFETAVVKSTPTGVQYRVPNVNKTTSAGVQYKIPMSMMSGGSASSVTGGGAGSGVVKSAGASASKNATSTARKGGGLTTNHQPTRVSTKSTPALKKKSRVGGCGALANACGDSTETEL